MAKKKGYLLLEDGTVYTGELIGNVDKAMGEVVFNTSMVGYEQIITDPSYAGQIIVMTYPLIGNYGVNPDNAESDRTWLRGLVVRELCSKSSHYEQKMSMEEYVLQNDLLCLTGVDTRAITRIIRSRGTMGGIILDSLENMDTLLNKPEELTEVPPEGFVMEVTRRHVSHLGSGEKRIVLLDFGTKKGIVSSFLERGCELIIVPADFSAKEILQLNPDGVVLSNGPGDPVECDYAIETAVNLLGKVPLLGICLGHQILSLALGGKTRKMVFGHRGANHPVKDLRTGRVYMTAQNHGYVVDENSLKESGAELIFVNINDGTVEGIVQRELRLLSVQFHPEASPGPQDTRFVIDDFLKMLENNNSSPFLAC
jgi:carbamoyl-phosphate synthase small subunit